VVAEGPDRIDHPQVPAMISTVAEKSINLNGASGSAFLTDVSSM
jgi:hypothetical protein